MKAALPPASPPALLLAPLLALAACAPAAEAPRPAPAAPPAARAPSLPAPAASSTASRPGDWMDMVLTPGRWRYERRAGGPAAVFVTPRSAEAFVMVCDAPRGRLALRRAAGGDRRGPMTIRTETQTRALPAAVQAEDTGAVLAADLTARDPLLDAMALSKGRFAVEVEGEASLYLPSWAEVSRVIEDCRG